MKDRALEHLQKGDIERALREIDNISTRQGLREFLSDIDKIQGDRLVPIILFARAHTFERLEDYGTAFRLAVKAGQLGLAAGFYRAGRILDEFGSSQDFDQSQLGEASYFFEKGAELGHVWSKIEVLRHGSRARFRVYRFTVSVFTILASPFSNKARMNVLY